MTTDISWIETALNGASYRVASPWPIEQLQPDDLLAGCVTVATPGQLVVSVEAGKYRGQELEPGSWWRVRTHGIGVLQRWRKRDDPQVGDRVVVRFRGHERNQAFRFDCGVAQDAVPLQEKVPAWE